ncbi:MAG: protease inhibitor I9 family protein, partial [Candidatus Methanoperedens sp.]|nr:protease inhibitor I9 family protein [Candidatus Methanoperedens sp.]
MAEKPIFEYTSIFFLMLIIFSIYPINTQATNDKISSDIKSLMLEGEKVPVIIILKNQTYPANVHKENIVSSLKNYTSENQKNLVSFLEEEKTRGNADRIRQFWIMNAIALNASPTLIEKLARSDDIEYIELDNQYHIIEDYNAQVSDGQVANAT